MSLRLILPEVASLVLGFHLFTTLFSRLCHAVFIPVLTKGLDTHNYPESWLLSPRFSI